jgi:ketosteroid isomerase-like protein
MSQENVEIVRGQIERFATTGAASPETSAEDIAWHDPPDFPDAQVHIGMEGAIRALRVWADAWSEWQFGLDEYVDAGDHVLVEGWQRGRGRGTDVVVEQPLSLLYLLRDGKVVEVRAFFNARQAREAAGLLD